MRGELWPMDRFGRVVNAAQRDAMTPLARRVGRALADLYRQRLGDTLHSVYLLGAAARGRPGPVEAIGVLRKTARVSGLAWLEEAAGVVRARWPAVGRPELALVAWDDVYRETDGYTPARFRIGVSGLCLAGRDLVGSIPPQALTAPAANAWILGARERVAAAAGRIGLAAREEDVRREARAIGRFLLAAGFSLVMVDEGVYTEDPDLQREFVKLNYPERAAHADLAYKLCVEPTASALELLTLLDGYGPWFLVECDRWLDRHNPRRLAHLQA